MTPQQANELLPQALTAMRDLDAISMALGARLAQIDTRSVGGHDYLLRDAVMREVMEWRRAWDKNSADRPDFAAWNRRAPASTEPAVDRDAVLHAQANAVIGFAEAVVEVGLVQDPRFMLMAKGCASGIRALATPASPAVPAESKLLPLVSTRKMDAAGCRALPRGCDVTDAERCYAAMLAAAPQVAQASQPTSAEELQQDKRMPPVAAPVSQPCADPKVMVELRRWAGDDPGYAARLIRAAITEIEKLESELASRCRAQGGITNHSTGLPTSAEGKDSERLDPEARQRAVVAIEREIDNQLLASGMSPRDMYRQDGEHVLDAALEAMAASTGKDTDKEATK